MLVGGNVRIQMKKAESIAKGKGIAESRNHKGGWRSWHEGGSQG
jgi:hypothetical protein